MWADHGLEFFIRREMQAKPDGGFPRQQPLAEAHRQAGGRIDGMAL